jgi:hypothetical protein
MFGYLYLTEGKVRKELQAILDKFDKHPGWCTKLVKMDSPADTPEIVGKKCQLFLTYVADIKRKLKRDMVPLKNMRIYVEQLTGLIEQVESMQDLPVTDAEMAGYEAWSGCPQRPGNISGIFSNWNWGA